MSDSGEGPRRSPSGQLRAIGVSIESLNKAQQDVFEYVASVLARRREHAAAMGTKYLVLDDAEAAAIADEIRGRQLRDLISMTFLRFQADIERSRAAGITPIDPEAPANPIRRTPTSR